MPVRLVRQRDLRTVTTLLTAAFHEDPLFEWFFPEPVNRPVLTGVWMRNSAELSMATGHALVSAEDSSPPAAAQPLAAAPPLAAALWSPPDVELFGPDGFRPRWALLVGANPSRVDELREGIHLLGAAHDGLDGHFYLNTLGVDAERRGQGLAQPLMERVLTVADDEGVPSYLESSNPRNLTFYERYGFEVMEEIELPNGPTIRPMWREPRS